MGLSPLNGQRKFADIVVNSDLTPLEKRPTSAQIFRFSAATWNSHRIHYDDAYATSEGYPAVLVQAHLHGSFLVQAVLDWSGAGTRLRRFRWENRHLAVPGDILTCTGKVISALEEGSVGIVSCELEERNQDGVLCAPAWAVVEFALTDYRGGHE
jgi:acyl dehydratase